MGTFGLLATTFYTFLPCFFFFVFAGAPLVERTEDSPMIGGVLELITAVVIGAILDLTLFLGKALIFPSGVAGLKQLNVISLSGVTLSLLLRHRFKLKLIPLVLLGIGFGSLRYFLGF
jgi:chromate transporter